MIKRFESFKELVRTDKQGKEVQVKDNSKDIRVRDDLPGVLATYPVITAGKPANTQYPKGYTECKCKPIHMRDLKDIKQAVVSYGMHSPHVRELVKTRASRNKVTPHDWLQLVSAVLDHGP